jgi:hypothetical protein
MWERNKFILEGSEKNTRNLFFALDLKHSLSLSLSLRFILEGSEKI